VQVQGFDTKPAEERPQRGNPYGHDTTVEHTMPHSPSLTENDGMNTTRIKYHQQNQTTLGTNPSQQVDFR
jgi:hypothetical protein